MSTQTTASKSSDKVVDMLCYLLLPVISLYALLENPFASCEERFILNTAYDFAYGTPYEKIHHVEKPHVVPRSVVPSIVLAIIAKPLVWLGVDSMTIQIVLRGVLGLIGIWGHYFIAQNLRDKYGKNYARAFLVISALQNKITFYISRTYPNIVAQNILIFMWGYMLRDNYLTPVKIICWIAVILRSEVALFLVPLCIVYLIKSKFNVVKLFMTGLVHSLIALVVTVVPDTLFWNLWGKVVWSELIAFIFNVVDGNSKKWGTHFFSFYLTSIPSMLKTHWALVAVLLAAAVLRRHEMIFPFLTGTFYVLIYSLLPHKEERFVTYTLPLWNMLIVLGGAVFMKIRVRAFNFILKAVIPVLMVYMFLASETEHQWRVGDYVGGIVAQRLQNYELKSNNVSILLSEHCVQRGATLFTLPKQDPRISMYLIEDDPSHFIEESSVIYRYFTDNCKNCTIDPAIKNPNSYDMYLCYHVEKPKNLEDWELVDSLAPNQTVSMNFFEKFLFSNVRRDYVDPILVYVKKSSMSKFNLKHSL